MTFWKKHVCILYVLLVLCISMLNAAWSCLLMEFQMCCSVASALGLCCSRLESRIPRLFLVLSSWFSLSNSHYLCPFSSAVMTLSASFSLYLCEWVFLFTVLFFGAFFCKIKLWCVLNVVFFCSGSGGPTKLLPRLPFASTY